VQPAERQYPALASQLQKIAFFGCGLRFAYRLAISVPINLTADLVMPEKAGVQSHLETIVRGRDFAAAGLVRAEPIPLQ
jgi:hypothetical protein